MSHIYSDHSETGMIWASSLRLVKAHTTDREGDLVHALSARVAGYANMSGGVDAKADISYKITRKK